MHKPTAEERKLIRDCAKRSAGKANIRIEPGYRVSLKDRGIALNIALITDDVGDVDDPLNETDLHDYSDWQSFCKGFELTPDGRGIVDFYVSSTGRFGELETNVTAFWRHGELVKITGTCNGTMWERSSPV